MRRILWIFNWKNDLIRNYPNLFPYLDQRIIVVNIRRLWFKLVKSRVFLESFFYSITDGVFMFQRMRLWKAHSEKLVLYRSFFYYTLLNEYFFIESKWKNLLIFIPLSIWLYKCFPFIKKRSFKTCWNCVWMTTCRHCS